jgi:hypothetical protein
VGHVACMGKMTNAYKILIGSQKRRDHLLGRLRRRWEDNIKMDLREIGLEGVNWIHLVQDRVPICFCDHGNE